LRGGEDKILAEVQRLDRIAKDFHLAEELYPPDPADPEDPVLSFKSVGLSVYEYSKDVQEQIVPVEDGEILVSFDLSLPIGLQIRRAKRLLERAQTRRTKKSSRFRTDQYSTYLRLLDARSEVNPLSYKEIGEILFPGAEDPEDSAKKGLKAALRIRDSLYWKIPLLSH
jgi:hypothetical protein